MLYSLVEPVECLLPVATKRLDTAQTVDGPERVPVVLAEHALAVETAETLEEVAAGESGLIATLDLANTGSAIHVLTEDLGVADGETFRLLGRASPEQLFASARLAGEMGLVNSTRLWSEHY